MSDPVRFQSIFRTDLFAGQTVLVTGGGTGIGRCTAHELASLGATVVIAGRREEPLAQTEKEITESGGKCSGVQLDIRDEEVVEKVVEGIVARHGRLDLLVNNAGGQFVAPMENMSPKGWRTVVDLNLNGTFIVSNAAYRHSMKSGGGAIVNMLADIWTGYPGMAHMSAARAGIENMTRTMTLEWGGSGVRINCIAPGTILSSGMLHYPPEIQKRTAADGRYCALGRLGTESEISAAIVFLLSPAASYVSGATLLVDGGSQLQKGRLFEVGGTPSTTPFNGFHKRPDFSGTPFEGM